MINVYFERGRLTFRYFGKIINLPFMDALFALFNTFLNGSKIL